MWFPLQRAPHRAASTLPRGSTSLALIYSWLCFFPPWFPQMAGRGGVKLGNYGSGPRHRFSPGGAATSPSLPCPLDLFHCPVGGLGAGWQQPGSGLWVIARARTRSTCRDLSCGLRGMAITISANDEGIMEIDGVTSEGSQVTSPANSPHLFCSTAMLMAGMQQVRKVTYVFVRTTCKQSARQQTHWEEPFASDGAAIKGGKSNQVSFCLTPLCLHQ